MPASVRYGRAVDSARTPVYLLRPFAAGKPACPEVRREPVKRTFQPHRKSRKRTHGFRKRMKTAAGREVIRRRRRKGDRKSTRLNSSHQIISYAVFCLKKKKIQTRRARKGWRTISPTNDYTHNS